MKTHGDPGWEAFPSYFDILVPRVLEFLKQRDLKITFFVVGQDAVLDRNREAIASIKDAGHEVGNHSFRHEPWLHLYSKDEVRSEIENTENAIESITGTRPTGFRGPGYSLSPTVLEVLGERGYEYDCSTLPTCIGPLARAFYFSKSPQMSAEERRKRETLFGKFSDGFQSLKPYIWNVGDSGLVEIPVTTMPFLRVPIHASYVIYLASRSRALARAYWRFFIAMCTLTRTQPSLLLHPLDLLSGEDVPELKFFPGMHLPATEKMSIVSEMLGTLSKKFDLTNMRQHAELVRREKGAGAKLLNPKWKPAG